MHATPQIVLACLLTRTTPVMARMAYGRLAAAALVCVLVAGWSSSAWAVDRSKFRTCKDTSFCRRHRNSDISSTVRRSVCSCLLLACVLTWCLGVCCPRPRGCSTQYSVVPSSLRVTDSTVVGELRSSEVGAPPFTLDVRFYRTGAARVRVTEKTDQAPRWEVCSVCGWGWHGRRGAAVDSRGHGRRRTWCWRMRSCRQASATRPPHRRASPPRLVRRCMCPTPRALGARSLSSSAYVSCVAVWGRPGLDVSRLLQYNPFKVEMYTDGVLQITVNKRYVALRDV